MLEAQTLEAVENTGVSGKVGIIVAEFNRDMTNSMLSACRKNLSDQGVWVQDSDVYWVPGSFEIPWMAQKLAVHHDYDVLIVFGVVIKGDTHHFEMIVQECARGIMDVMLKYNVPIIQEIVAAYNKEDAVKRTSDDEYNKGISGAKAAIKMLGMVRGVKG